MKKILCILVVLCLSMGFACAENISVAALKGPTAMGMVKMTSESDAIDFTLCASADEITPKLVRGELDIAALPANLAAILYQKTEGALQVLAINTLGVMYVAERGESVQSVADLKGKTLYSAGKGSTPEYALNYILRMNGLEIGKDLTVEWRSEHAECLSALMSDANAVAMLPQPFMTAAMSKAADMRIALDLTEEWDKLETSSGMITGVVVARRGFVQENPAAVEAFLADYRKSVAFVNDHPAEAAVLIEQYGIVTADIAEKAVPYCNICLIEGEEMQIKLSGYLQVLFDAENTSVGGKLPDEDFYYHAEG